MCNSIRPIHLCLLALFALNSSSCKKDPAGPGDIPPVLEIQAPALQSSSVAVASTVMLVAEVIDEFPVDSMRFRWRASGGVLLDNSSAQVSWRAPSQPGRYTISAVVTDPEDQTDADSLMLDVGNRPPEIMMLTPMAPRIVVGNTLVFRATANDSDAHMINYSWRVSGGQIISASGDSMRWRAPATPGKHEIMAIASDPFSGRDSVATEVVAYREAGSVWVADTGNRMVVKISAEGEVLFKLDMYTSPVAAVVDAIRRAAWIVDYHMGQVALHDLDGSQRTVLQGLGGPKDIDVRQLNGTVWVVESDSSSVAQISNDGLVVLRRIRGLDHPGALKIDQRNGDIYIADTGGHRVLKLSEDVPMPYDISRDSLHHQVYDGFEAPVDIDFSIEDETIWIVDYFRDAVLNITPADKVAPGLSGLRLPKAVAIDYNRGNKWVADTGNGKIIKVDNQGTLQQLSGFLLPHALVVDPNDGALWIADTENDRIVKCDIDGNQLFAVPGFKSPQALTINPGQ